MLQGCSFALRKNCLSTLGIQQCRHIQMKTEYDAVVVGAGRKSYNSLSEPICSDNIKLISEDEI